ncbi:MAG: alcohol dehydrogenase catalytic domain-containing protein [Thaumarchaeota archaeon]|jgi:NADPH:quinone reductase-like Zn-dependent oxidoreductase|nr:alcohol dehydrogenase catalytic domain-containing protein [Nitrososphaerota archaeon]
MEAVYERPGNSGVIKIKEAMETKLNAGEVMVKAEFGSVNHVDIWGRMDYPWHKFPRRFGSDLSGTIDDAGTSSTFKKGDRVLLYPIKFCGKCERCLSANENSCLTRELYGDHVPGFFAQKVSVPEKNVIKLPENVSLETAAALPVAYTTAWHGLVSRAGLRPGINVLILGGSGGAGVAALQIAKAFGARVFTTTSQQWKSERLIKLGAEGVFEINEKLPENVLNSSGGIDIAFDTLGALTVPMGIRTLKRGGKLVSIAMTTGSEFNFGLRDIYSNNIDVIGAYLGTRNDLFDLVRAVSSGAIKPVIDSLFPFEEVARAQEKMENRTHFGKILLKF